MPVGPKMMEQRLEQEERERERIEQELRVARNIQEASLPKEAPTLAGWQISPYYQPAREVGGDFCDYFALEDDRVGVVVGDATGKGIPAALVAEATSNMLRAVAQALGPFPPGEVRSRVNQTLYSRIPANMFVTCFYAILEPESASLSYANAGHDLPYLRRRGGAAEELRARGMPLGLMQASGDPLKIYVVRSAPASSMTAGAPTAISEATLPCASTSTAGGVPLAPKARPVAKFWSRTTVELRPCSLLASSEPAETTTRFGAPSGA